MIYPNRRPLLISAILVALTAVPTMIVVAAGTASLHQRDRSPSPAVAGPPAGPVIVGPGSTGKVRELPRATGRAVEPLPLDRRPSGPARNFGVLSRTGIRPEATVAPPAPVVGPSGPGAPPAPASPPPTERECPPTPTATPAPSSSTEPRMDDRAWPGWDRSFRTRPESGGA
jgi:hypothetical protein